MMVNAVQVLLDQGLSYTEFDPIIDGEGPRFDKQDCEGHCSVRSA